MLVSMGCISSSTGTGLCESSQTAPTAGSRLQRETTCGEYICQALIFRSAGPALESVLVLSSEGEHPWKCILTFPATKSVQGCRNSSHLASPSACICHSSELHEGDTVWVQKLGRQFRSKDMHDWVPSLKQFSCRIPAETSQPFRVWDLCGIISMIKEIMSQCSFCVCINQGSYGKEKASCLVPWKRPSFSNQ